MKVLANLVADDGNRLTDLVLKEFVDLVFHLVDFKHELIEV